MNLYEALEQLDQPAGLYEDQPDEEQLAVLQVSPRHLDYEPKGYWYYIVRDCDKDMFVVVYADIGSVNILYWMNNRYPSPIGLMPPEYRHDSNWKIFTKEQLFLFNGGRPEDWTTCLLKEKANDVN